MAVKRFGIVYQGCGMTVYDRILYYCGLVGIVLALGIIAMLAFGVMGGGISAIGKASLGLLVGIGLFIRGYSAKRNAKG